MAETLGSYCRVGISGLLRLYSEVQDSSLSPSFLWQACAIIGCWPSSGPVGWEWYLKNYSMCRFSSHSENRKQVCDYAVLCFQMIHLKTRIRLCKDKRENPREEKKKKILALNHMCTCTYTNISSAHYRTSVCHSILPREALVCYSLWLYLTTLYCLSSLNNHNRFIQLISVSLKTRVCQSYYMVEEMIVGMKRKHKICCSCRIVTKRIART